MANVITSAEALGGIPTGDLYDNGTDIYIQSNRGLERITDIGSSTFTSPTVSDMVVGASTTGILISGACTTGISITGATTNAISIANGNTGVAIKIGTLSSTVAGSGAKLDSTVTRIVEVNADDADAARTAGIQGRAIMGRLMSYAGTTQEDWAIDGLTKISAVLKTANVSAGVVGRFETTGTCSTDTGSGNTYFAGVMGRVGIASTTTIGAGAEIAAVLAFNNTATTYLTHTGDYCGFLVAEAVTGTMDDFDIGLKIKDNTCVTGIDIGVCTTGIVIDGASTMGMRVGAFASGGATTGGITFSTGMNVYSDGQLDVIGAYGASSSDLTSAYSAKVGRFRHMVNGTAVAHETYGLVGQCVVKDTTISHLHAGLMGTFEGHTSGAIINSSYAYGACGVMARVGGGGAITATTDLSGFVSFFNGAALAGGTANAFAACDSGTVAWTNVLSISRATNLLDLPAAGTAPCSAQTISDYVFTKTVKISVLIGDVQYYLIADTTA